MNYIGLDTHKRKGLYVQIIRMSHKVRKTGFGSSRNVRGLIEFLYQRFCKNEILEIESQGLRLLVNAKDTGVAMPLLLWEEYSPYEMSIISGMLKPGAVFYDVGANIGFVALLAAKTVGPKGVVVAFEPDPRNLKLFYENILINGVNNVRVFDVALSDREGAAHLATDKSNWGKSSLSVLNVSPMEHQRTVEVGISRLDELVLAENLPLPDVMKIDVEGAEYLFLKGATRVMTLDRDLTLVVEIWPHGEENLGNTIDQCITLLRRMGFQLQLIDKEHCCLRPLEPAILAQPHPFNIVARKKRATA